MTTKERLDEAYELAKDMRDPKVMVDITLITHNMYGEEGEGIEEGEETGPRIITPPKKIIK